MREGSPLRLTKLGEEIAQSLKADTWAEQTAQTLSDTLQIEQPHKIQEHCFNITQGDKHFTDEQIEDIKLAAYSYGVEESQVRRVFGIVLRDMLLSDLLSDVIWENSQSDQPDHRRNHA